MVEAGEAQGAGGGEELGGASKTEIDHRKSMKIIYLITLET